MHQLKLFSHIDDTHKKENPASFENKLDHNQNKKCIEEGNKQKPSQKQRIIDYIIQNGSINRLSAFTNLGVFELNARLKDLEKDGYKFDKERKTSINRYGEKLNYVEYRLK